jgi:hypothetical protein
MEHATPKLRADQGSPHRSSMRWACPLPTCWPVRRFSSSCSAVWLPLGAFIPLASFPMAIVLLVAMFTVHVPNGFSSIKPLSVDAARAHFGQPGCW